jgi:hypothetical protein
MTMDKNISIFPRIAKGTAVHSAAEAERVFGKVTARLFPVLVLAGYFLFEIPSNLLLERIGARKSASAHHAFMGHHFDLHAVRHNAAYALCCQVHPWHIQSRLFPA